MNEDFKPDLGLFFRENFCEEVSNHFYNVKIFDIIHVGHNLYSFTSNATYDNKEYAASFDFTTDKLKFIIDSLTNKSFANYLTPRLTAIPAGKCLELVGKVLPDD